MKALCAFGMSLVVLMLACAGCQRHSSAAENIQIDKHAKVAVGMSRDQVRSALGAPAHTQTWVKTGRPIFGALEGLWAGLPEGARVEIWDFPQAGGTASIYFLEGSNAVWHTSFVKSGVVF